MRLYVCELHDDFSLCLYISLYCTVLYQAPRRYDPTSLTKMYWRHYGWKHARSVDRKSPIDADKVVNCSTNIQYSCCCVPSSKRMWFIAVLAEDSARNTSTVSLTWRFANAVNHISLVEPTRRCPNRPIDTAFLEFWQHDGAFEFIAEVIRVTVTQWFLTV